MISWMQKLQQHRITESQAYSGVITKVLSQLPDQISE